MVFFKFFSKSFSSSKTNSYKDLSYIPLFCKHWPVFNLWFFRRCHFQKLSSKMYGTNADWLLLTGDHFTEVTTTPGFTVILKCIHLLLQLFDNILQPPLVHFHVNPLIHVISLYLARNTWYWNAFSYHSNYPMTTYLSNHLFIFT